MPHAGNRSDDDILVFGPFKLFMAKRELKHGDTPIAIGSRAIDLLIALVARAGQVVSHRDLMAQVWPGVTVEEANLRVHIAALRRALGDTGTNSRYISNVTGRGYTFVAPVERFYTERAPSQADVVPAAVHSNALPARVVQPVGRDETVRTLLAQLTMWRFISIVGPGGVGKTTVALTVAQASVQGFSGAVFFVDFSSVTDPRLVPGAVASSLGCTLHSHDPFPSLLGWLKDKRALLVLDNCESVVRAAAELAQRVIGAAPQVHILVTSREALRAEGEHVHILSSLDCPPEKPDLTAEEALRYPATQLFMDRAAAAGHRAKLADADAAVVARICRRLDGIALAIELAASRVGTHGIQGTEGLLDNRFGLAWKGRRTALPRHQTLTSMLDWSYRLLSAREKLILCRLSVCVGAFTAEAACEVAADGDTKDESIVNDLAGLLAKSLLSAMSTGGGATYRLLDITRSYASTKLEERGETDNVCRKHAMSFCRLLEHDATLQSEGEHDLSAYKPLVGNIRAALDWALSDRGEPAIGVKLAVSAVPLLIGLSLLSECGECCTRALALLPEEDRGSRAEMVLQEALSYSSMFTKGNSDEVRAALDRGLALAEKFKDANRQLHFLSGLNAFLYRTGDFRSALAVAGRAKAVAELANESAGMVTAEWMLGIAHHCVGDQAEAERHCQAGMITAVELAVFNPRFFRYDHRIRALVGLAGALWLRGYPRRALRTAQEAIDEAAVRNRPVSVCMSLYTAQAFFRAGALERARELAERLIEYAAQFALDPFRAVGIGLKAEFEIASGDVHAGVGRLREAIRLLQSEQHNVLYTIFCGALSEGLQNLGEYDEALIVANTAIDEAITSGAALELAELLRLKANVLASGTPANRAAALDVLDQSLRVAREQSALAYELRSATTLARLLSKEGQRLRAKQVLSPIYGRFTEGFDTPDLVSANVVLKGLE
ncbi:hypothetical protein BSZ21_20865 [Bradyrhizobium canariense]|uniref:ATP-binding protein n=1 Tax=Bradyrhizobium canariense TaxID=255045 RepID=UPI000A190084|nr:winged helix-turn-helix domain-containing protein [Bradyrhizobium canariense]OSI65574.1 hypothetical protein BSZ21_20865 [Bradyrhizobium canariense]